MDRVQDPIHLRFKVSEPLIGDDLLSPIKFPRDSGTQLIDLRGIKG